MYDFDQIRAGFAAGVTLRPGVSFCVDREHSAFLFVGERVHRMKVRDPLRLLPALERLRAGTSLDAFLACLPDPDGSRLLAALERGGLVRAGYVNDYAGTVVERQVDYFAAHVVDPNRAQRLLSDASVCLVGCGGVGGAVLQHLVGAGIERFWLIDSDSVAPHNFNRQFLPQWSDMGRPKVAALADYVRRMAPTATVQAIIGSVLDAADLDRLLGGAQPDIVLCCADTPPGVVQSAVLRHCLATGAACTFAGVGVDFGLVGPLLCDQLALRRYLARMENVARLAKDGSAPTITASFGATNTIISALMARDVVHYLAGTVPPASLNQVLRYRFAELGAIADGAAC